MSVSLPEEAQECLAQWPARSRQLFGELIEDATSELQRELLRRALLAGHSPAELHAFADELRAMTDQEAYQACTLQEKPRSVSTVAQLLRAEADPLYTFELQGGSLSPAHESGRLSPAAARAITELEAAPGDDPGSLPVAQSSSGFEAESSVSFRPPRADHRDLGRSEPEAWSGIGAGPLVGGTPLGLEDSVNQATRSLGISWQGREIDGDAGVPLESVIDALAQAVAEGIPVPLFIGPRPGKPRRAVLVLQVVTAGKNRAWQLFDVISQELAWANEGVLLGRTELPFANKANRRITHALIPTPQPGSF